MLATDGFLNCAADGVKNLQINCPFLQFKPLSAVLCCLPPPAATDAQHRIST
jgi:hypothetical protein